MELLIAQILLRPFHEHILRQFLLTIFHFRVDSCYYSFWLFLVSLSLILFQLVWHLYLFLQVDSLLLSLIQLFLPFNFVLLHYFLDSSVIVDLIFCKPLFKVHFISHSDDVVHWLLALIAMLSIWFVLRKVWWTNRLHINMYWRPSSMGFFFQTALLLRWP